MSRTWIVPALFALGLPAAATAACPDPSAFTTGELKNWVKPDESMDGWLTRQWCGIYDEATNSTSIKDPGWRDEVSSYVIGSLSLDEQWSAWKKSTLPALSTCNPNTWYVRLINGAMVNDYTAAVRAAHPQGHPYSPAITRSGAVVGQWTNDWVAPFSPYGYVPSCETKNKYNEKKQPLTTFASNPDAEDEPTTLFASFFFLKGPVDRGSTLVHEATHETVGHMADGDCKNGGSCDQGYMVPNPGKPNNVNAQSVQIVQLAQAIDAYTFERKDTKLPLLGRTANLGEPMVANFGDGTCGYVPFLTPYERALALTSLTNKLKNVFASPPPEAQWPLSAQTDPSGVPSIDVANGARWPCDAVCDVADYTSPDGVNAKLTGCDERWQPANAAVNTANRAACTSANAQISKGVTPTQREAVVATFKQQLKSCKLGVDPEVIETTCGDVIGQATVLEDVAALWPIPTMPGYYPAHSVEACELRFCAEEAQRPFYTPEEIADACYELDLYDTVTHCPDPCGAPDTSLPDEEQFLRALCHFSWFTGNEPPAVKPIPNPVDPDELCPLEVLKCRAAREADDTRDWEGAVAAWSEERADGGCWLDAHDEVTSGTYALWANASLAIEAGTYTDFLSFGGDALIEDPCFGVAIQCTSRKRVEAATLGRAVVVLKDGPPGPDPIEDTRTWVELGIYGSRDLGRVGALRGLRGLADQVEQQRAAGGDVHSLGELDVLTRSPEAHVALAGLAGPGTYARIFGAGAFEGLFQSHIAASVRDGTVTEPSLADLEGELTSLEHARETASSSALRDALLDDIGRKDREALFEVYQSMATAQTPAELDAAVSAWSAAFVQ